MNKTTFFTFLMAAGAAYAADSQDFTLTSTSVTQTTGYTDLGQTVDARFLTIYELASEKGMGTVFGAGENGGWITNWDTFEGKDGSVTSTSVKIYGRSGVAGEYVAVGWEIDAAELDLTRLNQGATLTFTVALSKAEGTLNVGYNLGIAIVGVDGSGTKTVVASSVSDATKFSDTEPSLKESVTMNSYDAGTTYYALTYILGGSGSATECNTLSFDTYGVSVKSSAPVPEPATATLSLLALAGLCARRRRK